MVIGLCYLIVLLLIVKTFSLTAKGRLIECSTLLGTQRSPISSAQKDELRALVMDLSRKQRGTPQQKLVTRTWSVLCGTEKETNFFLNRGWVEGDTARTIKQSILAEDGGFIENIIPFVNGNGFLSVEGEVISTTGTFPPRVNFKFTKAFLKLWFLPVLTLPPFGEGWFETMYVDDEIRVDVNSRDDIFVYIDEERFEKKKSGFRLPWE